MCDSPIGLFGILTPDGDVYPELLRVPPATGLVWLSERNEPIPTTMLPAGRHLEAGLRIRSSQAHTALSRSHPATADTAPDLKLTKATLWILVTPLPILCWTHGYRVFKGIRQVIGTGSFATLCPRWFNLRGLDGPCQAFEPSCGAANS